MAEKKTTTKKSSGSGSRQSTGSRGSMRTSTTPRTRSRETTEKDVKEEAQANPVRDEIWLIVALAFTVLMILSNFGLAGKLGALLGSFLFGMMGVIAYVFPYLFFLLVALGIANRGNKKMTLRCIYIVCAMLIICGICSLISKLSAEKITEYYTLSAETHRGGGLLGALIGVSLQNLVGKVGAYLILFALLLIVFTLLTGKRLLSFIRERSAETVQDLSEAQKAKREIAQEEREVRREQRRKAQREQTEREIEERRNRLYTYPVDGPEEDEEKKKTEKAQEEYPKRKKKGLSGILPSGMLSYLDDDDDDDDTEKEPEDTRRDNPEIRIQNVNQVEEKDEEKGENKEDTKEKGNLFVTEEKEADFSQKEKERGKRPDPKEAASFLDRARKDLQNKQGASSNHPVIPVGPSTSGPAYEQKLPQDGPREVLKESVEIPKEHRESKKDEILDLTKSIEETIEEQPKIEYKFPNMNLLARPKGNVGGITNQELEETALKLQATLDSFGVKVTVTNVSCGPSVTRYELQPELGVKISRITALANDIKMNLQATDIRIEAPIPGKAAVGIEVPNKVTTTVMLRTLLENEAFQNAKSNVSFGVGQDIGGQVIIGDIAKMPHLLVAGQTGSGKSVCINTIIMSILYKAEPEDVKFIMIDPKMVELSVYNGIPHLLIPVVTDPKKASAALNWAVMEMTKRYQAFAEFGVRDFKGYNKKWDSMTKEERGEHKHMPQIVIIVDELADLMMVAPGEVEDAICRLAQMARAAGMHLILATQRPSVNVITGLIKANVPSRIAFAVASAIDSRTILDGAGAEKLLGKGDMLYFPSGYPKPIRVQGAFVSDEEVADVVAYVSGQAGQNVYNKDIAAQIEKGVPSVAEAAAEAAKGGEPGDGRDEYFAEAGRFIIEKQKASIGNLQRVYRIGFNRAARIMDQLADAGVVGPEEGTKPRKVLMTKEEFEAFLNGDA